MEPQTLMFFSGVLIAFVGACKWRDRISEREIEAATRDHAFTGRELSWHRRRARGERCLANE